jgi:hypothetical protein
MSLRRPGMQAGLAAAVLFGAATPVAKILLGSVSPWMLAGLPYAGSGLDLGQVRIIRRSSRVRLRRRELLPLVGAGGILGPLRRREAG